MRIALTLLLLLAAVGFAQDGVLSPKGRRDPFVDPRKASTEHRGPIFDPGSDDGRRPPVIEGRTPRPDDPDGACRRARILAAFEGVRPQVVGVVYCLEEVKARLCLGIGLLGRATVVDTEVPVPKSNGCDRNSLAATRPTRTRRIAFLVAGLCGISCSRPSRR